MRAHTGHHACKNTRRLATARSTRHGRRTRSAQRLVHTDEEAGGAQYTCICCRLWGARRSQGVDVRDAAKALMWGPEQEHAHVTPPPMHRTPTQSDSSRAQLVATLHEGRAQSACWAAAGGRTPPASTVHLKPSSREECGVQQAAMHACVGCASAVRVRWRWQGHMVGATGAQVSRSHTGSGCERHED